jgi:hypothetical protein
MKQSVIGDPTTTAVATVEAVLATGGELLTDAGSILRVASGMSDSSSTCCLGFDDKPADRGDLMDQCGLAGTPLFLAPGPLDEPDGGRAE